ncbi:MAG: c-type cytochrome [Nitrospinae bacterium]|nr:c-type cytochrome [Nitrospinota bacterium]MZH46591.1 c-type cytochrome [Nitrospinota bacterium]
MWGLSVKSCAVLLLVLFSAPSIIRAEDDVFAQKIINSQCKNCHRFEGKPTSKFELKAPDLIWSGVKYQRAWLRRWLIGQEDNLYPNSYRWDKLRFSGKHMVLMKEEAEAIASYMEKTYKDPRIKKSFVDMSTFTEMEAALGAKIYRQYSCLACHQIKDGEDKKIGGPISVDLFNAGNRYTLDWWTRFAQNPQDFTPHSGEYLADISTRKARQIIGYVMTLGVKDFKFFEPWKTTAFKNADVKRGAKVYKEYCVQCHGPQGQGDGPGAKGLDPKPAVHADLPLSDYPEDYLYNLIFYGGKSVGKSPNMPDWGLTLSEQSLADVIAYLRSTFKG